MQLFTKTIKIMKAKFKILGLAACAAVLVSVSVLQKKESVSNPLLLMNIEALASGESGGTVHCVGYGSVDCPRAAVKVLYIQ